MHIIKAVLLTMYNGTVVLNWKVFFGHLYDNLIEPQ